MLKAEIDKLWPPDVEADSFERPRCWERLRQGEGDNRGMVSLGCHLAQWTWFGQR